MERVRRIGSGGEWSKRPVRLARHQVPLQQRAPARAEVHDRQRVPGGAEPVEQRRHLLHVLEVEPGGVREQREPLRVALGVGFVQARCGPLRVGFEQWQLARGPRRDAGDW